MYSRRPVGIIAAAHLQRFIKPAVSTVWERPASVQNLGGLSAGIPANQSRKKQSNDKKEKQAEV